MREECPSGEFAEGLRAAVRERYRAFAAAPGGGFPYPVGRDGALRAGHDPGILDALPPEVVARFAGVGNPLSVGRPRAGDRVLDLGCGAGLDVFVAGRMVGREGRAVGTDMVPEMLEWARRALRDGGPANLEFTEGGLEALPFPDASFDLVISNGALNLVPDKDAAFREIRRVLRPGGGFAAADLLVTETVPPEVLAGMDAWST